MEQDLINLAAKLTDIADKRNLAIDNPVNFRYAGTTGSLFDIVVSMTEPGYMSTPFNVTWVNVIPAHVDNGKVLRRTSKAPFNGYNNTWSELLLVAEIFNEDQYYDFSDSALLGENDLSLQLAQSTPSRKGIMLLSGVPNDPADPVVVCDTDSRLTDSRNPNPHSHPQVPATMLHVSGSEYLTVSASNTPVAGEVLFISMYGQAPNEFEGIWRQPTSSDIAFVGAGLIGINILGPTTVLTGSSTQYTAQGSYDDGSTQPVSPVWTIISGAQYASISATGVLTAAPNTVGTNPIQLQATYTQPGTTTVQTFVYSINVSDGVAPPSIITLEMVNGPGSIGELTTATYDFLVTYNNGTTALVTPTTFVSSDPTLVTTDPVSGTATSITNLTATASVTLTATYVDNASVTHTVTQLLSINDTTNYVTGISIVGPASVDESTTTTYTVLATYQDATTATVTPNVFTSSNPAAGSLNAISGVLTVGPLSANASTTLNASYTENGVTVTASLNVACIDTTLYPASAVVEGLASIDENTTQNYALRVTYTNGTSALVTGASWSVLSGAASASINATTGDLAASAVTANTTVNIQGSYTAQGINVTASKLVNVVNVAVVVASIAVTGSTSIVGGQLGQLVVTATYSDGTTADVTATSGYSVSPGTYATISQSGAITTTDPAATATETVTVQFTSGTTVISTQSITITNSGAALVPQWGNYNGFIAGALIDATLLTATLVNNMPSQASGLTITPTQTGTDYFMFAHPASMGTATFTDVGTNFALGMDSATWQTTSDALSGLSGPKLVTRGATQWKVYRADFSGTTNGVTVRIDYV